MKQAAIEVPAGPDGLTAEWMSAALSLEIASVEIEPIGQGRGFVGRLVRCRLMYPAGITGPTTLVAKFPSDNAGQRALFQEFELYEREVQFYREMAEETPVATPKCYFGAVERGTGDFVLLLEDLDPAQPGEPIQGCSPEEALEAVQLISRAHLHWWQEERLALPGPNVEPLLRQVDATYDEAWSQFEKQYGKHLPGELLRLGRRMGKHLPGILDRLASPPWTLVHGDYQLGNIFYDGNGNITAVADWQVVVRARGPMDVAHLLVRSLQPTERKAHERRLLQEYHSLLVAGGIQGYALSDCWDDYRLAAASQFGLGIVLAYLLGPSEEKAPGGDRLESIAAIVGARLIAALLDLQPLEVVEGSSWLRRLRSRFS